MGNRFGNGFGIWILVTLCLSLFLDFAPARVMADDDEYGSGQPASGYPQSGPPSGGPPMGYPEGGTPASGQNGSGCAMGGAAFGDPSKMPDPAAAMAELRKVDPALADKMEKLMQDAKAIAEEAARKAKEDHGQH